jgi:hypothetical protein
MGSAQESRGPPRPGQASVAPRSGAADPRRLLADPGQPEALLSTLPESIHQSRISVVYQYAPNYAGYTATSVALMDTQIGPPSAR